MSTLSIRPYFPFCRVRVVRQSVSEASDRAQIDLEPDARFHPICHVCGQPAGAIHQWDRRLVRDLDVGATRVWINYRFRTVYCPTCQGHRVEDLELCEPRRRVPRRLACYIYALCKVLPIDTVAEHLGLDWKTVKQIDQTFLEEGFGRTIGGRASRARLSGKESSLPKSTTQRLCDPKRTLRTKSPLPSTRPSASKATAPSPTRTARRRSRSQWPWAARPPRDVVRIRTEMEQVT